MKVEIIYYEMNKRQFRSKKTLTNFLKTKRRDQILQVVEIKGNTHYMIHVDPDMNLHGLSEDL